MDRNEVIEHLKVVLKTCDVQDEDAVEMAIKALEQPEIIHCKDCKFAHMTVDGECKYCDIWFPDEKTYMPGDYFCGSAERKEEAE